MNALLARARVYQNIVKTIRNQWVFWMQVAESRQCQRCVDCGSYAVTLRGTCEWHLPSHTWRPVQAELAQMKVAISSVKKTKTKWGLGLEGKNLPLKTHNFSRPLFAF